MASPTHIVILHEAIDPNSAPGAYRLCLHWGRYQYGNGAASELGYRFMWRRPDNSLSASRGQARLPSKAATDRLWAIATREGWGHFDADANPEQQAA